MGGSAGDTATAVAVDKLGNVYVTGFTSSFDFPTTSGAFQSKYAGSKIGAEAPFGVGDAFVAKLDSTGTVEYSSYLGGTGDEIGLAIAVEDSGSAVIAGSTSSADFPATEGAAQPKYGGAGFSRGFLGLGDGFITKINQTGSALLASSYLGGTEADYLAGLALDKEGNIYVAGATWSPDFPTTPASYKTIERGRGDAIVAKLDASATRLVYTAILGGSDSEVGFGVGVDSGGNAYISGTTRSRDFPTTPGAFQRQWKGSDDVYISKLNAAGTALIYSTFLGGSGTDSSYRFAVDAAGNAFVAGETRSRDLPVTANAIKADLTSQHELFLSRLEPSGAALTFSTYLGGTIDNKATRVLPGADGSVWVVGFTASSEFPVTVGAAQTRFAGFYDVFLFQVSDLGLPGAVADIHASETTLLSGVIKVFNRLKRGLQRSLGPLGK